MTLSIEKNYLLTACAKVKMSPNLIDYLRTVYSESKIVAEALETNIERFTLNNIYHGLEIKKEEFRDESRVEFNSNPALSDELLNNLAVEAFINLLIKGKDSDYLFRGEDMSRVSFNTPYISITLYRKKTI
jgi:hypothetical protein